MVLPEETLDLETLLDARAAAAQVECPDDIAAIRKAAELLIQIGAISAGYVDAAVAREQEFPTGLATRPVGVALPHTDQGVLHPAISLLTLRTPVLFREMGTGVGRIPVSIVIMLALPAGDAHVQAIGTLAEMIQQPGFLEEVTQARTSARLHDVFRRWVNDSRRDE